MLNPLLPCAEHIEEVPASRRGRAGSRARGAPARDAPTAGRGRDHGSGGRRPLPVPALGRHAPARRDRRGARTRPGTAHRRRAVDRARRHHPERDPALLQSLQESRAHGAHPDHARPPGRVLDLRPGLRPLRRRRSRGRARPPPSSASRFHPYTLGLLLSEPPGDRRVAELARSRAPCPRRTTSCRSLCVRAALPVGDDAMLRRDDRSCARKCRAASPRACVCPRSARR